MSKPDYNDGTSVECQAGQHPAEEVAVCSTCDMTMCLDCEREGGICLHCEREAVLSI